jgi:hypothetical protein
VFMYVQGVTERCGQILGMSFSYKNKKKWPYQHESGNITFVSYSWKCTFITGICMPRDGLPLPFRDVGAGSDSLTSIHSAMKWFFVVNRSCIHKGVQVSPRVNIHRIQIWCGAWMPCSGSSCTYPSVMTGVAENISRSTEHQHAGTTFVL